MTTRALAFRLTGTHGLARQVESSGGTRAGGVHRHTRAAEVVNEGDAVGDNRERVAGHCVLVDETRVAAMGRERVSDRGTSRCGRRMHVSNTCVD